MKMIMNVKITIEGGLGFKALISTNPPSTREDIAAKLNELPGVCIAERSIYIEYLDEDI